MLTARTTQTRHTGSTTRRAHAGQHVASVRPPLRIIARADVSACDASGSSPRVQMGTALGMIPPYQAKEGARKIGEGAEEIYEAGKESTQRAFNQAGDKIEGTFKQAGDSASRGMENVQSSTQSSSGQVPFVGSSSQGNNPQDEAARMLNEPETPDDAWHRARRAGFIVPSDSEDAPYNADHVKQGGGRTTPGGTQWWQEEAEMGQSQGGQSSADADAWNKAKQASQSMADAARDNLSGQQQGTEFVERRLQGGAMEMRAGAESTLDQTQDNNSPMYGSPANVESGMDRIQAATASARPTAAGTASPVTERVQGSSQSIYTQPPGSDSAYNLTGSNMEQAYDKARDDSRSSFEMGGQTTGETASRPYDAASQNLGGSYGQSGSYGQPGSNVQQGIDSTLPRARDAYQKGAANTQAGLNQARGTADSGYDQTMYSVQSGIDQARDAGRDAYGELRDVAHGAADKAATNVESAYDKTASNLQSGIDQARDTARDTYGEVRDTARGAADKTAANVESAYDKTASTLQSGYDQARDTARDAYGEVRDTARNAYDKTASNVEYAVDRTAANVEAGVEKVENATAKAYTTAADTSSEVAQRIQGGAADVAGGVREGAYEAKEASKSILGKAKDVVVDSARYARDKVYDAYGEVKGIGHDIASLTQKTSVSAAEGTAGVVEGAARGVKDGAAEIEDAANAVRTEGQGTVSRTSPAAAAAAGGDRQPGGTVNSGSSTSQPGSGERTVVTIAIDAPVEVVEAQGVEVRTETQKTGAGSSTGTSESAGTHSGEQQLPGSTNLDTEGWKRI